MKFKGLISYFIILVVLCSGFIILMKILGKSGAYLAQAYMLTPAIAGIITRAFFYEKRFTDANIRFGKIRHYITFWLISLGITVLSYVLYTLLGAVIWDFTGETFLNNLQEQLSMRGQNMEDTLPKGFTPEMMLLLFTIGGLTIFNVLPGIITGFGEEFGHRGFMFPQLYKIRPWVAFIIGGIIWFIWHLPLTFVSGQEIVFNMEYFLNILILLVGSLCTFFYLAYVYVKTESVFVTAIAHIVMNNSAASFSYYVIIENQVLANLGLTLTMMIVVIILYFSGEYKKFKRYFDNMTNNKNVEFNR
jgi:membrane protease YdiL (CAAX protease family)